MSDELRCGPFAVAALAEQFGTPLYLYHFDWVRRRLELFRRAFPLPDLLIAYSVKANGNLALLRRLAALGTGADIVSEGELFRARKAGIPPARIVFAGVGKTEAELRAGLEAGIGAFHVETTSELHRLEELARERGVRAPFSVRINPGIEAVSGHEYVRTGHTSAKFGLPIPVAVGLYRWAATRPHLLIRGVDLHLGSQIESVAPYRQAARKVLELVRLLRKEGIELSSIDLGGGFAIPGPGEGMDILALGEAIAPMVEGTGLRLILEPGRSLVGEAGLLLTRVLALKRAGEKLFVITDAGMSELLRPSHYGGFHVIEPVGPSEGRKEVVADVVGPLCESGDFLARDRRMVLPEAGEVLAVRNAGAYGFTMASNYNARPRPAEVLVDGEEILLARTRETLEDLIRGETPEGLPQPAPDSEPTSS